MSRPQLPESAYAELGLPPSVLEALMNPKPPPMEQRTVPPPDIAAPNLLQSDEDGARPMQPNETSITLYAELLLHIRTVTLFASLRTNHSRETKARASADGSCVTVSHEGESATIRLPFNVKGGGDAALSLPSQPPTKELTLRMQLEETDDTDVLGALNSEDRQTNVVPWDGASLNEAGDVTVCCKHCGEVMVGRGRVREWRDLPNENWAEMMDFWHCHKPDDESHTHGHEEEQVVGNKGYAAANRLQALERIGFVDLTSFLFTEEDCHGAQLSQQDTSRPQSINCRHCDHLLGHPDAATSGWRLEKWNLGIRSPIFFAAGLPVSYSAQKWISARFLSLIENTGIRKFNVHPPLPPSSTTTPSSIKTNTDNPPIYQQPPITPSINLWLFTPDLLFSSSLPSPARKDPTRAMKIFYKNTTHAPLQPGQPEPAGTEDVEFPPDLYEELDAALRLSGRVLPVTARRWGEWGVGVLERFDGAEVLGVGRGRGGGTGLEEGGLESEDVD